MVDRDTRAQAKTINFAILYGISRWGLAGRLGVEADEAQAKFGFLLDALRYGCPPHGGIAFGIDRIATLMCGVDSIREVIAFPKTASAQCPLTEAPSEVSERQLQELSIRVVRKEPA